MEIGSLPRQLSSSEVIRVGPNPIDWCPYKMGKLDTEGGGCEDTRGEDGHVLEVMHHMLLATTKAGRGKEELSTRAIGEMALPTPWF